MRAIVPLLLLVPLASPTTAAVPVEACGAADLYCVQVDVVESQLSCSLEWGAWSCTWSGGFLGTGSTSSLLPGEAELGAGALVTLRVCAAAGCRESIARPVASCAWAAGEDACRFERAFVATASIPVDLRSECVTTEAYAGTGAASARPPRSPAAFAVASDVETRTFEFGGCA